MAVVVVGAQAVCEHRVVFEQEQIVMCGREESPLESMRVGVAHAP